MHDFGVFGTGALTLVLVVAATAAGYFIGRRVQAMRDEPEPPVGAMVAATLGLLAFLLAFTFGMAAEKHAQRRALVLHEANAIGTTLLRADFLGENAPAEVRRLLIEYVDVRVAAAERRVEIVDAMAQSERLQTELWAIGSATIVSRPEDEGVALFIEALNEMLDLHTERVAIGVRDRLPVPLRFTLYLLTIASMLGVGYHAGMAGAGRLLPLILLVLAFSMVMLLIADLDHPADGLMKVDQRPLIDLLESMHRRNG